MTVSGGLLVGVASWTLDWRLLIPIALGIPIVAVVSLATDAPVVPREVALLPRSVVHHRWWLAATWAGLYLLSTLRLIEGERSVRAAAAGVLSADIALELVAMAGAGLTVVSVLVAGWPGRIPWLLRPLVGFSLLAALSVAWSALPLLSAVRALELVTLAMFTAYTALRAQRDDGFLDEFLPRVLRVVVLGTVAVVAYGILEGGLSASRFTWRGTHPNTAAALLVVPVLALLFHPRRAWISRPIPWWVVVGLFSALAYQTGARGNVGAAVAAGVAAWSVAALRNARVGAAGGGAIAVGGALASWVAADRIIDFVMRDQEADTVLGLNGRWDLWRWVLDNPVGSEFHGVGIGAVRGGLPRDWAGNTHSAWIELLQSLGVLGLAAMGALVVASVIAVVVWRSPQATWMLVLPLVASVTSTTLAEPKWGLVLFCLGLVALHHDRWRRTAT